jgi:hypothetical protein
MRINLMGDLVAVPRRDETPGTAEEMKSSALAGAVIPEEGMSIATQLTPVNDQASQPVIDGMAQAATASPEESWFEQIRPDFIRGNASIIAGAAKLIEAKAALRKNKGSFLRLVEKLGLDLDKAERFMKIARNPVLRDSAHARNLPLSWMTLAAVAAFVRSCRSSEHLPDDDEGGRLVVGRDAILEWRQAVPLAQRQRAAHALGSKAALLEQAHDGTLGSISFLTRSAAASHG